MISDLKEQTSLPVGNYIFRVGTFLKAMWNLSRRAQEERARRSLCLSPCIVKIIEIEKGAGEVRLPHSCKLSTDRKYQHGLKIRKNILRIWQTHRVTQTLRQQTHKKMGIKRPTLDFLDDFSFIL